MTEEEFSELEAQAAERGVNLSEWVRGALLSRPKEPEPADRPDEQTILAEVMALRPIVINVVTAQAQGDVDPPLAQRADPGLCRDFGIMPCLSDSPF